MGGGITRLRNNAFTLIELLAIIVILAIIAVITVPIILNIIENSRKGAATDSAYGYKDSVNKTYITELQTHNTLKLEGEYTVNSDGQLVPATDNTFKFGVTDYNTLPVSISGDKPSSGSLTYENNVLKSGWLVIGDYKVTFNQDGTVTTVKNASTSQSNVNIEQYGFKTFDPDAEVETEMDIGISGYTVTGRYAYLKYSLTNGIVASDTVPEACIYNESNSQKELCLKNNEYETSVQKAKSFFGYDSDSWITNPDDSTCLLKDSSADIGCCSGPSMFYCYDNLSSVRVDIDTNDSGRVNVSDSYSSVSCSVNGDNSVNCQF